MISSPARPLAATSPEATPTGLFIASTRAPSCAHGAAKCAASSFCDDTHDVRARSHVLRYPLYSPTQSAHAPDSGDGGTSAKTSTISARARFRGATPRTTPTRLAAVNPRRECVEEDASGTVDARGTTAARMTESGGARM